MRDDTSLFTEGLNAGIEGRSFIKVILHDLGLDGERCATKAFIGAGVGPPVVDPAKIGRLLVIEHDVC